MDSGAGFTADLHAMANTNGRTPPVTQPALVIATPGDGAVPSAHARSLADTIPTARLITSQAPSRLIWFAPDYPAITTMITDFLEGDTT
ncbi:MAG: alpha/beta fold hydrolase [Actinomadura sp.]